MFLHSTKWIWTWIQGDNSKHQAPMQTENQGRKETNPRIMSKSKWIQQEGKKNTHTPQRYRHVHRSNCNQQSNDRSLAITWNILKPMEGLWRSSACCGKAHDLCQQVLDFFVDVFHIRTPCLGHSYGRLARSGWPKYRPRDKCSKLPWQLGTTARWNLLDETCQWVEGPQAFLLLT